MKRGVFWLMEGNLLTFTFDGTKKEGVSKSGNTYNHKRLWAKGDCYGIYRIPE